MVIEDLVKSLNLSPEQIHMLREAASKGPLEIMQAIQRVGISPDAIQKLIGLVMANPGILQELARKYGVPDDLVQEAQKKLTQSE